MREEEFRQIVTALSVMHRENIVGTRGMVDLQSVLGVLSSHVYGWYAVVQSDGRIIIERC